MSSVNTNAVVEPLAMASSDVFFFGRNYAELLTTAASSPCAYRQALGSLLET